MRILITGFTGFIGSHFLKHALAASPDVHATCFGRNSALNDQMRLTMIPFLHQDRYKIVWGDLANRDNVSGICEHIDVVVNFAAKTFVDHSLKDDEPFLNSNVIGSRNLMLDAIRYGVKRFIQVSTDEVYGQILIGAYKEDATLNPRNPYAWSKACADLYAIQLHRTHGFPVIVTRTENNFGPWQHRQKVLPVFVRTAMEGKPLPVYGDGLHVRCWLHVEEHCRAIWHLIQRSFGPFAKGQDGTGLLGEVFHIAGEEELTNIGLARFVLQTLGKTDPQRGIEQYDKLIQMVPDHNIRPGHDQRYALNCDKLRATGFTINQNLHQKLQEAILWYRDHPEWTR